LAVSLCAFFVASCIDVGAPTTVLAGTAPPNVPGVIKVPARNEHFLTAYGVGSLNYVCLPSSAGFGWMFFGPQATLFNDHHRQIISSFFSSSPPQFDPANPVPTFQTSDTSSVWTSRDAAFNSPSGAIEWLRLKVIASQPGPTGGDTLLGTTYILRVNTAGGVSPATGCSGSGEVGAKVFMPYTADYLFYGRTGDNGDRRD
jgi:hypothetical protein